MADGEFASLNVMAIEDEAFTREAITKLLESIGVNSVTIAENGADALTQLAKADAKIHLIICDIEMPEMGGYEFVRKVRYGAVPKYKDVPILILTGKDTDENAQKARFHKIDGFIVKPPNAEDLERKLRKALGL